MAYKYYFIRNKSSGLVLDVAGGSALSGVQVIMWFKDENKYNQQWRFDDETKTVRSRLSDSFVLDISGATLIVNAFEAGKESQRWQRVDGEKLLNVNNPTYCIDLCASDPAPGATVIRYPFYGTTNQLWEFEAVFVPRQEFYIVSQLHSKVVGIRPGTSVLEIQPKADPQQKTQLFYDADDGYLRSAANDLSLSAKRGDQLSLTQDNANAWNQWKFDEAGVKVIGGDNVAMDIKGGFKDDGTDVVSWDWHGGTNQKWGKELVPLPVQRQLRLEGVAVPTSSASYPPNPFVELRPGQWGFQFPSFGGTLPSVDVSLPSVDIKPPSVDVSLPSVGVSLPPVGLGPLPDGFDIPSVEIEPLSVGVSLPSVDVSLPSVEIEPLSVGVSLPSVDVGLPSVDVSLPSVDVSLPSVDVGLPSVDIKPPSAEIKSLSVGLDLPSIGLGHPPDGLDLSTLESAVIEPLSVDVSLPSVGLGLSSVYIKPPSVNVTLPPLGSGSSLRQEFYIVSQLHEKVATVNSSGKLEIQPKAATVEKNQLFFTDSNGYLHSAVNDLALTSKKGDQFSLSPESDDPSTQWKFDDSGTRVVDAAGNVLDIQGGSSADGVAVVSWEDKNQNNQRWNKVVV